MLILSMIGSGLYCLSSLSWGLTAPTIQQMVDSGAIKLQDSMTVAFEQMIETPRSFYLWSALLYAVSLTGVILMWNLRKLGFHLYTLAQLFVLVITVLFLGKERLLLGDVMFTLLFIISYYVSLRRLGVFNYASVTPSDNDEGDNLV